MIFSILTIQSQGYMPPEGFFHPQQAADLVPRKPFEGSLRIFSLAADRLLI
jgi:hypothetical protein